MPNQINVPLPARVQLSGLLGRALAASQSGHLAHFITDATSPPIALFHPDHVACNHEGDWYGEHAGKWLYTAARAAHRTDDAVLAANVRHVADYLVGVQGPDGYLGTYAPPRRFMCTRGPAAPTWDGAPALRTWDIWVHSYLILGLLEAGRLLSAPRYIEAAARIGDLCWHTLTAGGISILSLGNHFGLSATVLLDPAVELYFATGEKRYLELAQLILQQASAAPSLALLPQALAGADAATIGTGKAYQLAWNFVGIAKLHRATGEPRYRDAALQIWENIRSHHLTLGGGPWGGVGHRSREVFNAPSFFSPYGFVETCSTLAWIQLNRELFIATGEAIFADEIERAAYNALLGAQAPEGENWCYYSFPNGKRVFTTYWRCCKSSGPMALEELPPLAYALTAEGHLAVNLYGVSRAELTVPTAGVVKLEQITRYPFAGSVRILVNPERPASFGILVRIPGWADRSTIAVNGVPLPNPTTLHPAPNAYVALHRVWQANDVITLDFVMAPVLHFQTNRSVQESRAPDGSAVSQEVIRHDYVAVTHGPLVYATGLIDDFKPEETVRLPVEHNALLEVIDQPEAPEGPAASEAPAIQMNLGYRPPLTFRPYYEAGGRTDGAWRLTWLQLAPE